MKSLILSGCNTGSVCSIHPCCSTLQICVNLLTQPSPSSSFTYLLLFPKFQENNNLLEYSKHWYYKEFPADLPSRQGPTGIKRSCVTFHSKKSNPRFWHFVLEIVSVPAIYVALALWPVHPCYLGWYK
jgi:hypothetical protein